MSMESHHTQDTHKDVHGMSKSYVIGYILSLIFTFIPYYLVVNKTLTGSLLLGVILSIGVLQMVVQLVFFLHLGRGPKPLYNIVFFFATAGVIIVTIGASLFIMSNLYHNMSPQEVTLRQSQRENISQIGGEETGACNETYQNHIATIKDGRVSPMNTRAERCDTLTFLNEDDVEREIMFGSPDSRISYGGEFEIAVEAGEPETITLNQTGEFMFYDSKDAGMIGYFSIYAR